MALAADIDPVLARDLGVPMPDDGLPEDQGQDGQDPARQAPAESQEEDIFPDVPPTGNPEIDDLKSRLIAAYGKKTRALADERKTISEAKQKAATLDLILKDERFRALLTQPNGNGNGQKAQQQEPSADEKAMDAAINALDEGSRAGVDAMVRRSLEKFYRETLMPAFNPFQAQLSTLAQERVMGQFDGLAQKYGPVVKENQAEIARYLQETGGTDIKAAVFAVCGEEILKQAGQKPAPPKPANPAAGAASLLQRQQGQLLRPGPATSRPAGQRSIAEIVAANAAKLRQQGHQIDM